jgi:hypothetical protein
VPLSGQLEELGAEDILESADIEPFEAAAACITSFDPPAATSPATCTPAPIEVEVEVEVEGPAAVETPLAPTTSPLPLESLVVADAFPERTLEMRGEAMNQVAAAAAALDEPAGPGETEVLVRSEMPAALQAQTPRGGMQAFHAPPLSSLHTPHALPPAPGASWQNGQVRQAGSIAPVARDVASSVGAPQFKMSAPRAPKAPPPLKRGLSALAIGGIAVAAVALIGIVGVGGYMASRSLSTRTAALAPAHTGEAAAAGAVGAPRPSTNEPLPSASTDDSNRQAAPVTLDVSALPSAPPPEAARRGVIGTSTPAPATGGSPLAAPGSISPTSATRSAALPPPGAAPNATGATLLPPPVAAPVAPPAPAAAAPTTGVVRVDSALRAVVVDGSYRRANDGVVVLTCGTPRIKAGMKETQTVNVPCGGSVSL